MSDPKKMSRPDILAVLDQCAAGYDFPILNNVYFFYAAIRMTVFRTPREWLMVFEEISYSKKAREFVNWVSAYGNQLPKSGPQGILHPLEELPGHPIVDGEGHFLLNKWDFSLAVNGQPHRFTPTREDYARAGIDVDSAMPDPAQIVRLLVRLLPAESLFSSHARLLHACGRKEASPPLFVELRDWSHPDVAAGELPSGSETFRSIADAIVTNDRSLIVADKGNTHWSNWLWDDERA